MNDLEAAMDGLDWLDEEEGEEPLAAAWKIVKAELARLTAENERLKAACEAGARYSNALRQFWHQGLSGQFVEGDHLDQLFQDWHDKTHAAIDP